MTARPDRVDLGYRTLRVEWVAPATLGDAWGAYRNAAGLVQIVENQTPVELANTLLHELLHAVYDLAALEAGDDEERVTATFANGLTELLRRNPGLLDWLREQLA